MSPARKRACPRHLFACVASANGPGIGARTRACARCVRKGISRARCQRKHCRAMELQSAQRLTPVSWASHQGCPRSRHKLVANGREARQRHRTGPSQAQSRLHTAEHCKSLLKATYTSAYDPASKVSVMTHLNPKLYDDAEWHTWQQQANPHWALDKQVRAMQSHVFVNTIPLL